MKKAIVVSVGCQVLTVPEFQTVCFEAANVKNVKIGDVVIIQDSKQIRGNWRLARVSNVFPSDDGRVRRVELQYKNEKPGEPVKKYAGSPDVKIQRPIQRIVVIVLIDEDNVVAKVDV